MKFQVGDEYEVKRELAFVVPPGEIITITEVSRKGEARFWVNGIQYYLYEWHIDNKVVVGPLVSPEALDEAKNGLLELRERIS